MVQPGRPVEAGVANEMEAEPVEAGCAQYEDLTRRTTLLKSMQAFH